MTDLRHLCLRGLLVPVLALLLVLPHAGAADKITEAQAEASLKKVGGYVLRENG
jgi:hypothetical protein